MPRPRLRKCHGGVVTERRGSACERFDPRSIRNDRVGGARNDDREAGQGTASPRIPVPSTECDGEDGCGNDVPMETPKRFPQGLGNLAQHARFPHSHKPIIYSLFQTGEDKERRPGATADQPDDLNDLDLRICLDKGVHFTRRSENRPRLNACTPWGSSAHTQFTKYCVS